MKQSLLVILMFALGCLVGRHADLGGYDPHSLSIYILYALMFQVGLSVGSSGNLRTILQYFRPKMLLLPFATLSGTLLMSAVVSFLLTRWSAFDCMAVGGGMGYYSLSSILVTQLKADTLGRQMATELGTIALLSNICREMIALVGAPIYRRYFGPFAPVTAAGVTSVDVALPAISRVSGSAMIPIALFHGMVLDLSVPILIPLLCEA